MQPSEITKQAGALVEAAPCQVVLPAGCGKTHLAAHAAAAAAASGKSVLVLTHTHAAVDAVRRRLKTLRIANGRVTVSTIAAWFTSLVGAFPVLSGHVVGDIPDHGAVDAAALQLFSSPHLLAIIHASYDLLIVDEYQDCNVAQHEALMALFDVVPIAVLGDPLQCVLDFPSNTLISWDADLEAFPSLDLDVHPWRWTGANEALGEFTLELRRALLAGAAIDLATGPLQWRQATDQNRRNALFESARFDGETVALHGVSRSQSLKLAKSASGLFGVMEEIAGGELMRFASVVDQSDGFKSAAALAAFASDCFCGLSSLRKKGVSIASGTFPRFSPSGQLGPALSALETLTSEPSASALLVAMDAVRDTPPKKLVCREAWEDVRRAVKAQVMDPSLSLCDSVERVRDRARRYGRHPELRVVSRVPLFKGQQCGRCIAVLDQRMRAAEVYVALTRATHQLVVLSGSSVLNS